MKALRIKNKLIRENYKKTELNSFIYSALIKNNLLCPKIKENLRAVAHPSGDTTGPFGGAVSSHPVGSLGPQSAPKGRRGGFVSEIRNICVITGRARAVVQKYKMSRIQFKQNAEAGLIPGIKKL